MNRVFAAILLFIFLPFMLLIALVLLFQKGRNVFFVQYRLGKHKNLFKVYKFRSMLNGEITFIGKIIRKTGIDELPQLLNIMIGDMNFVGPRPLTEFDVERLGWEKEEAQKRWDVKPGLSGLAQLMRVCNADLSLNNDLYYVDNKSVKLNVQILWKSALIPFVGKPKKI